ncbi:hypothetical protein RN001_005609 [Aquatica leii]|uniref:MADF domain-containing protein n=1 Tax=Aquatica leii TaxID=1421715 RepID=A0AAN7Q7W6_9COLE|nr:hypothetical protein RN001_005609 [Aquatica leii]
MFRDEELTQAYEDICERLVLHEVIEKEDEETLKRFLKKVCEIKSNNNDNLFISSQSDFIPNLVNCKNFVEEIQQSASDLKSHEELNAYLVQPEAHSSNQIYSTDSQNFCNKEIDYVNDFNTQLFNDYITYIKNMDKNVFVYPVDSGDSCLDDSDDDPDFVEELESFSADSDTGSDYITDSDTENISSNNQTQRRKTKIQWTHVLPENSAKVKPVWLNKLEYCVSDYIHLYDKTDVGYKSLLQRENCWQSVATSLLTDVPTVKARFKALREKYRREVLLEDKLARSGSSRNLKNCE